MESDTSSIKSFCVILSLSMAFENNNNTKLTKVSHISQNLSLSTIWKSIAISGALLFLLHTFAFNHPHKMLNHKLFAPLDLSFSSSFSSSSSAISEAREPPTNISHLMFFIVGSTKTWRYRRGYIEPWWRPNITKGHVFLERPPGRNLLPWPQQSPPFSVNKDSLVTILCIVAAMTRTCEMLPGEWLPFVKQGGNLLAVFTEYIEFLLKCLTG